MLKLNYYYPANNSALGWEQESLAIGNGYLGANIFGIVERDRIQITENSLQNPQYGEPDGNGLGGLNNFAEVYLHFAHENPINYERGLDIGNAVVYTEYTQNGIRYRREYIASYPDKVVLIQLTSDRENSISCKVEALIPFIKDYAVNPGDGGGKSGQVQVVGNEIILTGRMNFYNILFQGRIKVSANGGSIISHNDCIEIKNANSVTVVIAGGTSYKLSPQVFLETNPQKKCIGESPAEYVAGIIASFDDFESAKSRHISDYTSLFGRVKLELDGGISDLSTDELLERYRNGETNPYLETLYFQYGRYLLISSSRPGGLPSNLQGIWNCHDQSPWGSGYWHNINVQMNYWPAFNTNLFECFEPYVAFWQSYLPKAEQLATEYILEKFPESYIEGRGNCGFTIGTAAYPYLITEPGGHSGPGTGALTTKLFWDYYDFTQDANTLREITYPALLGMSRFLTKTIKNYDGEYLTAISASPEQMNNGAYVDGGTYYITVGCAFDQQMIAENGADLQKAAAILGIENDHIKIQRNQQNGYNPVQIGASGQIKEFREESFYGEIGEYHHRHISQLMALYPGTLINSETPAWIDAAKYTLNERGDESTGWALAHRLNAWARTGDGNRAHKLLRELLGNRTYNNFWDAHPPFQIDGNLGGTAGIAEMLLQSHEGYISILPALPDSWETGKFFGLTARGGFEVSVSWTVGQVQKIEIKSLMGGTVKVKYENISRAVSSHFFSVIDNNKIELETTAGEKYTITEIPAKIKVPSPTGLSVDSSLRLKWNKIVNYDVKYNVYRAENSSPSYVKIVEGLSDNFFCDSINWTDYETLTYKITAVSNGNESSGVCITANHATLLEQDRYRNIVEGKKR